MSDNIDIRLLAEPLDAAAAVQAVATPEAGGIDVFLGTTRGESDPKLGPLVALDYEAYPEMAIAEITKLVQRAKSQWPICRIVVWHRTGRVNIGEPSVIIAVSCPHRGEAFDACRFVIDELKKLAPIWKKEIYNQSGRWQGDS